MSSEQSAPATRDKYDQWVFEAFGVDPSTYPPKRARSDAPHVEANVAAITSGMDAARATGPLPGIQVAQLAVPGMPLPLPLPTDALPAVLPLSVERDLGHALDRASRRLGEIGKEVAHGDLASAAKHALLGHPFPPEIDDPGLVPPLPLPRQLPGFNIHLDANKPTVLGGTPVPDSLQPTIHTGSPPPTINLGELQEAFPALPQAPTTMESQSDPGLTQPSGPVGGVPTGMRSTTEKGAKPADKAQVDSENQVAAILGRTGYQTVQRPTEGTNPPLTPERMNAEGLREQADPDLLIEDRIFDTYTPLNDNAASVRNGIAKKVEAAQTHRVVVDLRRTTQTEATVRAALRTAPVVGLKEIIIVTAEGLGQPFRP